MIGYVLLGLIAAAVVGALLVALGWRGRRVGAHPVCARCGFDLSGRPQSAASADSARPAASADSANPADSAGSCPECGRSLDAAKAIATGDRHRRWVAFAAGVLLLVGSAGIGLTGLIGGPSAHRLKPTVLILWQARIASPTMAGELGAELLRRHGAGEIDAADYEGIIDGLLAIQADRRTTWVEAYGDFIERGGATPEQDDAYCRQMPVLGVEIRERVANGAAIPVRIWAVEMRKGSTTDRELYLAVNNPTVNGAAATFVRQRSSGPPGTVYSVTNFRVLSMGSSLSQAVVAIEMPDGIEPGPLSVGLDVVIRKSDFNIMDWTALDAPWWQSIDGLAATMVDAAATASLGSAEGVEYQAARNPPRLSTSPHPSLPPYLAVSRVTTDAPVAHRMLIVYPDGTEIPVGWYTNDAAIGLVEPVEPAKPDTAEQAATGVAGNWAPVYVMSDPNISGHASPIDRPVPIVDGMRLVLRPDPWIAEYTINVFEVPEVDIDMGEIEVRQMGGP